MFLLNFSPSECFTATPVIVENCLCLLEDGCCKCHCVTHTFTRNVTHVHTPSLHIFLCSLCAVPLNYFCLSSSCFVILFILLRVLLLIPQSSSRWFLLRFPSPKHCLLCLLVFLAAIQCSTCYLQEFSLLCSCRSDVLPLHEDINQNRVKNRERNKERSHEKRLSWLTSGTEGISLSSPAAPLCFQETLRETSGCSSGQGVAASARSCLSALRQDWAAQLVHANAIKKCLV